jgi:PKD repeat protein
MCISVTPADPNYIYVLSSASDNSFGALFRSTNSGTNFTSMSTSPNIFGWDPNGSDTGGQGWYDIACGVSPTNKNELICGGVNTWKSLDGGVTWNLNTHWYGGGAPYVHADLHAVEYISGTTCYLGTDGGIARTTNSGSTWTTINGQMNIAQSYRMGQSTTTANYVLSGHQDNGTNLLNGTTWTEVYGGDGMDCFVDRTNNNVMVESYVEGDFNLTNNGGASWSNITNGLIGTGAWVSPIIQSAHAANTYYCGYQQVFKTTNKGTLWTQMGTINSSGDILSLAAAPSNSLVLYAASSSNIFKTVNGGASWTSITTGLPSGTAQITRIAVDNTDANNIFITFSGYSSTNKVYMSSNGGLTYTNISAGLPNLPANCIVYANNSNDAIYVGTDVGVYYRDGSMNSWTPFMTGLPNVIVNDLEIFYPTNKLRAATYGRGIWQSDLFSDPAAVPTAYFSTAYSSACINTPFLLSDQSSNMPTAWTWSLTGASPSTSTIKNPTITYNASGVYTISLISTNGNGASAIYTSTISVIAPPTITLSATASCNGQPANLSASGATTYIWSSGSTGANTSVTPNVTSVYTCTGSVGACNSTKTITVNVGSVITPTITQNVLVLTSSASSGNQWYLNGSPISGETFQTYTVTQSGFYSVWVTSVIGCQSSSSPKQVTITGLENNTIASSISLSPNPAKDVLFINGNEKDNKKANYSIYSIKGQLIKSGELFLNNNESISISDLSAGVYEIKVSINQTNSSYKFIKE